MTVDPRLVNASRLDDDAQYEAGLRPRLLDEYIGQERVRAQSRRVDRGRAATRRGARSRAVVRPARTRQDDARLCHRQRARRHGPVDVRSRAREARRRRRDSHQPAAARRPVHRRSPPDESGDRGKALLGDGGLRNRHHDRAGAGRAVHQAAGAAVHAHRGDDAGGAADGAAPIAVWHRPPPRLLRRDRPHRDCDAVGAHPERGDRARGGAGNRPPVPRHTAHREPAPASRPGFRAGTIGRAGHRRCLPGCAGAARGGRARLRRIRPAVAAHDHRQVCRRSGRAEQPGRGHRRRERRDRRHLRAVSHPDRLPRSHLARARRHGAGVRILRV